MVQTSYEQEILEQLHSLNADQQRQVLQFVRSLSAPEGIPGKALLRFVGMIPTDDLAIMAQAIEEDCENIDLNGW
jgi:hypothetical protein